MNLGIIALLTLPEEEILKIVQDLQLDLNIVLNEIYAEVERIRTSKEQAAILKGES